MRPPLFLITLVLAGCATTKPSGSGTTVTGTPPRPPKSGPPIINPVYIIIGKIVLINDKLRYVVIDFSLGRRPDVDARLNVYRQGQKVGEVKISNQAQENNVAADITAGDVRAGDEVREN